VFSDGQALDWAGGGDPFDAFNWKAGTRNETVLEDKDDVTYEVSAGDLGEGDGTTGHAESKMTYSNEYPTSVLLQSFGSDTNWQGGVGEASLGIADDQHGIGMSGSRTKFLVNVPAGQQFTIPYILHVALDGVGTNDLPGAAICATNYYATNTITGMGYGIPMFYPSGQGLLLQPPYTHVNNGCADLYYGGSADISLLGWICLPDGKDKGGATPCPLCADCNGMPKWWVTEPYINLWVADKPVDYVTSLGEKIAFALTYKQRDTRPQLINGQTPYLPINGWNNNWYSYVHFVGVTITNTDGSPFSDISQWTATVYEPNGGEGSYDYTGSPDPTSGDQLLPLDGVAGDVSTYGFRLVHPDGSQEVYATVTPPYPTKYTEVVPIMQDAGTPPIRSLSWSQAPFGGIAGVDIVSSGATGLLSPVEAGTCTPAFGSWSIPLTAEGM